MNNPLRLNLTITISKIWLFNLYNLDRFIDFTIGFDNDIAEQQYRNNVPIGHVEYFSM